MSRLRLPAALVVLLATTACTDQPTAIQPPDDGPNLNYVTSLNVICPASVQVSATTWCDVWAWRSDGSYTWESFTGWWYSSNSSVLNVWGAGNVQGVSAGSATVYVWVDGVLGTAPMQVTATPVPTSISVTPSSSSVAVGQGTFLTAKVLDQNGQQMSGYSFTWSSSNGSVATVGSNGYVSGGSIGSATITAEAVGVTGISGSASVSVVPEFDVSIEGEDEVKPNQSCTWWASVSGGTAPYSYSWSSLGGWGSSQYEPSSWTGSSSNSSFVIYLTVTDANQVSVSAQKTVHTNPSLWMECPL
jgi:hypothetical protein